MEELKELQVGESPFDEWGREHLVRFAQRCYAALRACAYPLNCQKTDDLMRSPVDPFWQGDGTGARAISLMDSITREVGYDAERGTKQSENLYRAFYRNYLPLLFADAVKDNGDPFFEERRTCDACHSWVQASADQSEEFWWHGKANCGGTFRVMTPDDLPPVKDAS